MDKAKFIGFGSIENLYRQKEVNEIHARGNTQDDVEWMVMEKIHGANFSLAITKDEVRFCSRNNMLDHEANFNNLSTIREDLKVKGMKLFQNISEIHSDLIQVTVFGELAGGEYPHANVPRVPGVSRVQKGVFYCPHVEFFGYDIVVVKNFEENNRINGFHVDALTTIEMLDRVGFKTAPVMQVGTFRECKEHTDHFQSRVPGIFRLPEIEENICEGIILKIVKQEPFSCRDILKSKNEKFTERKRTKKTVHIGSEDFSGQLNEALSILEEYVNENRLNNLFSKIGKIEDRSQIGKYIGLLSKDALEDFKKDNENLATTLAKEEQKLVNKKAVSLCSKMLLSLDDI